MTHLTIATVNDDWGTSGTNLFDLADVDVVLIQEGKRMHYADIVDKTRGVLQDTSSQARAGSAIVWTLTALVMQKTGLTFGVKADGFLARYLAWLRCTVAGRKALLIAAHRPAKRGRKWWHAFDLALAARVRAATLAGRVVVVGIDANEANPRHMAFLCGLRWHSTDDKRIDGFLVSRKVKVLEVKALPRHTSDHEPLVAALEIPAKRVRKPKPKPEPPKPAPAPVPVHFPAVSAARQQSHHGPQFGLGECMMRVRECYGIPSGGDFDGDGDADAEDGWKRAKAKHRETVARKIPRGYPVFWTGGSNDNGHVAISAGAGMCWSSDIVRTGFFDLVPIDLIHAKWGLTLVGWVEDLNGVRVDPHRTGATT